MLHERTLFEEEGGTTILSHANKLHEILNPKYLHIPKLIGLYKDVQRKIMNNQHYKCILEANYYLSVYNVHFKLRSSTEQKNSYLTDPVLAFYTKI